MPRPAGFFWKGGCKNKARTPVQAIVQEGLLFYSPCPSSSILADVRGEAPDARTAMQAIVQEGLLCLFCLNARAGDTS